MTHTTARRSAVGIVSIGEPSDVAALAVNQKHTDIMELVADLGGDAAPYSSPLDECWEELNSDPDLTVGWEMRPPSAPPNIRGLSDAAAANAMVDWFQVNFEGPAESTPWDDGEYVYIWGGPCAAREELEEAFWTSASERALEVAVERIEEDGWQWAPAQSRMQPETSDALTTAKLRLMAVLRIWRARTKLYGPLEPQAEFNVCDVATLLRAYRQLQLQLAAKKE